MKKILLTHTALTGLATRQMLDNKEHMVVPVVALMEGVLNGRFYSKKEIANSVQGWNGVPVPVGHPIVDEKHVSAKSPEYEDTINIGTFYNVEFKDDKLKGEMWINIEKAERLGFGDIIAHFDAGEMMEVSTGLLGLMRKSPGVYNNKTYEEVVTEFSPDHLALLPNELGACSIEDGCGALRVNQKDDSGEACCDDCENKEPALLRHKLTAAAKMLGKRFGLISNETSHEDIRRQIGSILDAEKTDDDSWPWVVDIFDDTFIYESNGQLYSREYSQNDGVVSVGATKTKVIRKTTYEPVLGLVGNKADTNQPKESEMDKTKLIDAIIANAANTFGEDDRASLLNFDEDALQKMQVNSEVEAEEVDPAKEVATNVLSDEDMATFKRLANKEKAENATLRARVLKAYPKLAKEAVANMDMDAINGLIDSIPPVHNFAGANGGATQVGNEAENKPRKRRATNVLLNGEDEDETDGDDENGEN